VIQNPFPLGVKAEVRLVKGTDLPAGRVFRRVEEHMFIPQGEEIGHSHISPLGTGLENERPFHVPWANGCSIPRSRCPSSDRAGRRRLPAENPNQSPSTRCSRLPGEWIAKPGNFQTGGREVDDRRVALLPHTEVVVLGGCNALHLADSLGTNSFLISGNLRHSGIDHIRAVPTRQHASRERAMRVIAAIVGDSAIGICLNELSRR